MRTIQSVECLIYGTGPAAPEWCEYVGKIHSQSRIAEIVQAVNSYDQHVQLLEQAQATLAMFDARLALSLPAGLHRELARLQEAVNAAVINHHEFLEDQT